MTSPWDRVLRHLGRHGYLRADGALGPLGLALMRNVTREWRREVELRTGVSVLPTQMTSLGVDGQIEEVVAGRAALKKTLGVSQPAGVAARLAADPVLATPHQLTAATSADGGSQLALFLTVPHKAAADWFRTLQRKRRIWWRELAADPGNYSCGQPSTDGVDVRFREKLVVERLRDHGKAPFIQNEKTATARNPPHLLSCHVRADAAFWAVCGDALDGGALRLQERLAPYRRAVLAEPSSSEELRALAVHLTNQLRSADVPVFPLPVAAGAAVPSAESASNFDFLSTSADGTEDATADSYPADMGHGSKWVDSTLRKMAAAGVPFCVLLDESTLQTGVCRLWSRDTTLCQQLHVSQVVDANAR